VAIASTGIWPGGNPLSGQSARALRLWETARPDWLFTESSIGDLPGRDDACQSMYLRLFSEIIGWDFSPKLDPNQPRQGQTPCRGLFFPTGKTLLQAF
jgi:hypothetical protein